MRFFLPWLRWVVCGAAVWLSLAAAQAGEPTASPSIAAGGRPVDVILVLDNSGSMKKNDPDFLAREVVIRFLGGFDASDRVGMVIFDGEIREVAPLSDLGDLQSKAQFARSVGAIDYSGRFTDSPSAVERALYELKTHGRDDAGQVVILLTDGIVDTGDRIRDAQRAEWLKEDLAREAVYAGIRTFGIAFTDQSDFRLIQTLALRTGGRYFRAYTAEDVQGILGRIKQAMRQPMEILPDTAPDTAKPDPKKSTEPAKTSVPADSTEEKPAAGLKTRPADAQPVPSPTVWPPYLSLLIGGVLILMVAIILIQLANRKTIPSRTADAVSKKGEDAARPVPPDRAAVLVDVNGMSGSHEIVVDRRQIKIGRDSGNDIVVAEETVSSLHAVIEYRDGFYFLEDQRSKNGTWLNDVALGPYAPHKLKSGDAIRLHRYSFRFILPDMTPVGETAIDFDLNRQALGAVKGEAEFVPERGAIGEKRPQAILIDVKNVTGQKTVRLDKELTTIGRGAQSDVVIARESVSGAHAVIAYRDGAFYLEDQRSKNRTRLNGDPIEAWVPEKLKSGDEIRFDAFTFIFLLERQMPAGDTNGGNA